jgi:hypothetical protein
MLSSRAIKLARKRMCYMVNGEYGLDGGASLAVVGALTWKGALLATAADGVQFGGAIPYDLDRTKPVGVRAQWAHQAAAVGARTITFTALYKTYGPGAAMAAAATALDTVIAAQAPTAGATAVFQYGTRGIIAAGKVQPTDLFWAFRVTMSAFNAAFTENKYLLGLELDYMPRFAMGPRAQYDQAPGGMEDWRA